MENQEVNEEEKLNAEEVMATEEANQTQEKDEYKDKYFYLAAEMQNMQKRFDREKSQLIKYGNENILKDLLEVVDNFERTIDALKNDNDEKMKNVVVGIEMISKQFLETLKKFGLEKINALGETFDPNFHEALAQMKVEGKKEMEIFQVHQNGYILNDRLLRPSKVVVVKNEEQ